MLKHGFLSVVGEQPAGFFHHAIQRCDIADVVAMHCMNGDADLERGTQGVDADQVTTVNDRLRPGSMGLHDRRHQGRGTVMAVGNNTNFHVTGHVADISLY